MHYSLPECCPKNFKYEIRKNNLNQKLIIVFTVGTPYSQYKYNFPADVLFITDTKSSYYTFRAGMLSIAICDYIIKNGYKNVIFIGSSKAAFAAILISSLVSKKMKNTYVGVLAFSPQVNLLPTNKNLMRIPSYRNLVNNLIKKQPDLDYYLNLYGNLNDYISNNVYCNLFYGELNEMDALEAHSLTAPNIKKTPLPICSHNSLMPFYYKEHIENSDGKL